MRELSDVENSMEALTSNEPELQVHSKFLDWALQDMCSA
jgi:hypothetical protein